MININDPTAALIEYTGAIKPYHSKILDVTVEYIHTDPANVTTTDTLTILSEVVSVDHPSTQPSTSGYGSVWDTLEDPSVVSITNANYQQSYLINIKSEHLGNSQILVDDHQLISGNVVKLVSINAIPDTTPQVVSGNNYTVTVIDSTTIELSIGLTPITFDSMGQMLIVLTGYPVNSFDVTYNGMQASVSVFKSRCAFTNNMLIAAVDITTNSVTVNGAIPDPTKLISNVVFINNNTNTGANSLYTVSAITINGSQSTLKMIESIPLGTTVTGYVGIVSNYDQIPSWRLGSKVVIHGNTPVDGYFQPTQDPRWFNLSSSRYSKQQSDIIVFDQTTHGEIQLIEPFIPGDLVDVSQSGNNDGKYSIKGIEQTNNGFRLLVHNVVKSSATTGVISLTGNFGSSNEMYPTTNSLRADSVTTDSLQIFQDSQISPLRTR